MHIKAQVCLNIYIFLFYSFVYFFIALPLGSVCRFIFFYKFNRTDPGLQLGDPAPLIGLLLWTCWHCTHGNQTAHSQITVVARAAITYKLSSSFSWLVRSLPNCTLYATPKTRNSHGAVYLTTWSQQKLSLSNFSVPLIGTSGVVQVPIVLVPDKGRIKIYLFVHYYYRHLSL